ncbi:MAG: cobalt ECF transporter T component CbiQ [Leptolyngbya sp. SIO4C1]|nr:cobalt ECF transporter T component CbiQ [Leptolyngbya sp. SIO4C1]
MRLTIDTYSQQSSAVHRWAPAAKLVGLITLIFGFAAVRQLWLVPYMIGTTAGLYALSRLPLSFLRSRLRYPGLFLVGVVVALPLFSGETVLWQWGLLSLRQEGLLTMLLVAGRFLSILTVGIVLLGTTPFLTLIKAMQSLGLPSILADMTLLAYRYLFDIASQLSQMRQAMRLRGFYSRRANWQQIAAVMGTLLIRSYEQSERVYKAMRLRGYGTRELQTDQAALWGTTGDRLGLALCAAIALSIVIVQWLH